MTPEQWHRVADIFAAALQRPRSEQNDYVAMHCGAEPALAAEVTRLIEAHYSAGSFGEAPLFNVSASSESGSDLIDSIHSAALSNEPLAGRSATSSRAFLALAWTGVVATAVVFAYGLWLIANPDRAPGNLGWVSAADTGGRTIASIGPQSSAAEQLVVGDRVVSLNGVPPSEALGFLLHAPEIRAGDAYTLRIERNGVLQDITLFAERGAVVPKLIYFFVSLIWCGIGLFIGIARSDSVLARLACITSLAVGFVFLEVGVINGGPLWQPLHAVFGFHFLARFPSGRPTRGLVRLSLVACYLVGGAAAVAGMIERVALITSTTANTVEFTNRFAALFGFQWPAALLAFSVATCGMIFALAHNYRSIEDKDQRRRLQWVLYGGALGLLPLLWWIAVTIVETLLGPQSVTRLDLLVNAATIAIPIAMAYAVVRHRVLDIRVVIRRGLQYMLAQRALRIAIAVPLIALIYVLVMNRDRTLAELVTQTRAYVIWLVMLGFALKFRAPVSSWLDRRFFREQHDREHLMAALLEDSRHAESLGELSSLVNEALSGVLHPSAAYVWYRDPDEHRTTAASHPDLVVADLPEAASLIQMLEQRGSASDVPALTHSGLGRGAQRWFNERGIELIVPMTDSGDRLIGAFLLGEKKSEEPYDETDVRFLDAIAKQTAVIRENLRLRARLSDEVRVRRDVLSRLDGQAELLLKECPQCGRCFDGGIERCPDDNQALLLSLPITRTVDDRYRLQRLLGKGGMGAVYEALDLQLDRSVAIKLMLQPGFAKTGRVRRFRREARAAARLNHPNVVSVYDIGMVDDEIAYIVMERIHGETLREVLKREQALAPDAMLQWFEPILRGINAAHAAGIIHRDLKPENVMGERGAHGYLDVRILDLGLAKLRSGDGDTHESMTQEGVIMGTPDYMAPEQLFGREVDARADLYAVGVMLLEALTGEKPASARVVAVASADEFECLPAGLRDLITSCLAAEADQRPPSADALLSQLRAVLR